MKTMFKVMAEYSDYEGKHDRFNHKVGMAETIKQAHELANAKIPTDKGTYATGKYQVIECTMDEKTFSYSETVVFEDYTPTARETIKKHTIEDCNRYIEIYTNEINKLNAKIEKRIAQGKAPTNSCLKDIEYYKNALARKQEILNGIK